MLLPIASKAGMKFSVVTPMNLKRTIAENESERGRASVKLAALEEDADREGVLYPEIDKRLSFVYPHEAAARLKSKYSVSELNRKAAETARYYVEDSEAALNEDAGLPADMRIEEVRAVADLARVFGASAVEAHDSIASADEKRGSMASADAAARGTALHRALEKLDYSAAHIHAGDASWFDSYLDGLADAGFLTAEQRASVGADDLIRFADSDICGRAAIAALPIEQTGQEPEQQAPEQQTPPGYAKTSLSSSRLRKETPFNYRMEMDGEQIIVQGIIDLFFEEDGELVLVDFKSGGGAYKDGAARARHMLETYGEQIRLYREALEAITGKRVKEALLYLTSTGEAILVP
jgi:ATP-dependent helicase/nuclease subunit A